MGRLKLFGEPEGGGTSDHSALSNLGYADSGHTGFVPSQGEALIEILRLTQNTIRDSGGNDRITLSPASPHVALGGDLRVTQHLAVGANAAINTSRLANLIETLGTNQAVGAYVDVTGNKAGGSQYTYGVYGSARGAGTPGATYIYGLYFNASHESAATCYSLSSLYTFLQSAAAGIGAINVARGCWLPAASWGGSKPTTVYGIDIGEQGGAGVGTAYGLRIVDQTAAAVRLLELGPFTPHLRLVGGGDPPADKSNLYLKFGSTLYRVVKTGSSVTLEAA